MYLTDNLYPSSILLYPNKVFIYCTVLCYVTFIGPPVGGGRELSRLGCLLGH